MGGQESKREDIFGFINVIKFILSPEIDKVNGD